MSDPNPKAAGGAPRDDCDAMRKRVYELFKFYRHRKDGPGLKKLGATIVLCKTAFQEWLRRGGTL
jgi:hypothetical protein